jgi:NADH:ubiquinone oxidoreductase subunit H
MLHGACPWARVRLCPCGSLHNSFQKIHLELMKRHVNSSLKVCAVSRMAALCTSRMECLAGMSCNYSSPSHYTCHSTSISRSLYLIMSLIRYQFLQKHQSEYMFLLGLEEWCRVSCTVWFCLLKLHHSSFYTFSAIRLEILRYSCVHTLSWRVILLLLLLLLLWFIKTQSFS